MTTLRRVRIYSVPDYAAFAFFNRTQRFGDYVEVWEPDVIPNDAKCLGVWTNHECRTFDFLVQSEMFAEVENGAMPPREALNARKVFLKLEKPEEVEKA